VAFVFSCEEKSVSDIRLEDLIPHPSLQRVLQAQALTSPTQVQERAIPAVLAGRNLLVSAKTGSGKTLAFLLPAIQKLLTEQPANATSTRLLIMTPTRELGRQILKIAEGLLKFTPLKVGLIAGGEELKYQKALLRKNPEIIIATPGRLAELVAHKATDFSALEILVLDEADRMLEMGLAEDVLAIVNTAEGKRQTLLFSATLEQKGLRHLIKQLMQEQPAEEIHIEERSNAIKQEIVLSDDAKHKEKQLLALLSRSEFAKAIVFTKTKARAAQLDGFLRYHQHAVSVLHGDMSQDDRKRSLDLFRQNRTRILVATDVAARGLDIPGVELVINLDMAQTGDDYLHRIGRTGRAGKEGRAVSLISASEWNLMSSIERYLKLRFDRIEIPGLVASYQGPKKVKSSGKAASTKKKADGKTGKTADSKKKTDIPKVKVRERDKKNIGKRRQSSSSQSASEKSALIDGFAPLKRKNSAEKNLGDED
jgi:ATP-dependent RNA helicase SrmB